MSFTRENTTVDRINSIFCTRGKQENAITGEKRENMSMTIRDSSFSLGFNPI